MVLLALWECGTPKGSPLTLVAKWAQAQPEDPWQYSRVGGGGGCRDAKHSLSRLHFGADSETVVLLHSWIKGREDHLRTSIIPKPWNCGTGDRGPRNHCRLTGGSPSLMPEWEEPHGPAQKACLPKGHFLHFAPKSKTFSQWDNSCWGELPLETPCFETVKHNRLRSDDESCCRHQPLGSTHFDSSEATASAVLALIFALFKSDLLNVCTWSQKMQAREEFIGQTLMGLFLDFRATA